MEQARLLLERLERIDRLHAAGESRTTLQELRSLLEDGERWLAVDAPDDGRAGAAPGAGRTRLEADGERASTGGPLRRAVAAGPRERRS